MSPDLQLQDTYREWRRLAQAEGDAIRSGNWSLVADCQKAMRELQPLILRLSAASREELTGDGPDREKREKSLSDLITEVFEIESCNSTLLQNLQETARAETENLERAGRLLRQVHERYVPSRPAAWISFS